MVVDLTDLGPLALRMHDAPPRDHQVDIARGYRLQTAQRVPVQDFTLKQIGHSGDVHMRVGPHIDPGTGGKAGGPHVIEKYPGSDHLALHRGQHAAHRKTAQVLVPRLDNQFDRIAALRHGTAQLGLYSRATHSVLLRLRHKSQSQYRLVRLASELSYISSFSSNPVMTLSPAPTGSD